MAALAELPSPLDWVALDWALLVVAGWLAVGAAGILALRRFRFVARCCSGRGLLGPALSGIAPPRCSTVWVAVLLIGCRTAVPLASDAPSVFFLLVIARRQRSGLAAGLRRGEGTPPGLLCLQYHVFLASMAMVVLADDAYAFMVMWETMALSSFFLVTANHRIPEIRRAGYIYLLVAHVGAIGILMCFGVLQANTGDYTFANMRAQQLTPFWASVGFLLAVFGFGAKAGILPLHVWLPEAHPAAPSPVSALMSGVMFQTAIYGVLRVSFDLLSLQLWWWGALLLALGLATALYGVVFAAVQVDMKRLLAYSSIENIGLLFTAIGLGLVFSAYGMRMLAALALTAGLYHVASHALFKSLLFLGTGSVLHATGERNLGKLGGLIRYTPWVAWVTLVGVLASAGLPAGRSVGVVAAAELPVHAGLPHPVLNMLIPGSRR